MDNHPTSMELKSTELTIGGISKVPVASQENPSVDTAEKEASPRSSFTIDKINIGGISTVPGGALQEKASDDTAKWPQENEPVIDEASPESLPTVIKPAQENPSMEELESQKENPFVAPSHETPSSAIVEASAGSTSTMVETSEVIKPSSEIAGFGEENPPAMGEEASPESIPEERPSIVVSGPAQETTPATDVDSLRSFTMEERPLEGAERNDIDKAGFGITLLNSSDITGHLRLNASGFQNFQCSKPTGGHLVNVRQISQKLDADAEDTLTVSRTQGSDQISFPYGKEPTKENPATKIAECLAENPSDDSAEPATKNPSDNDFSFDIKPAHKLNLALEALSNTMFNPSGTGRIYVNEKVFGITVLSPSDISRHLCLNAKGVQNFQCSKSIVRILVDAMQILDNRQVADDLDTVTVSYTQGSDVISFTFGKELKRGCTEPCGEASREVLLLIHHYLPRFPTPVRVPLAHSLLRDKVEFLTHLERIRVAFEFLTLPVIRSPWNPTNPFATYIRQYYAGDQVMDMENEDWETVTQRLTVIHVILIN